MEQEKKGFWRNFTWKKFALTTAVYFLVMTLFTFVFDYLFDKESTIGYFTTNNLIRKFLSAVFICFFLTIWIEPRQKKKP